MDLACISPNLGCISAGGPLNSPKCFSPGRGYFKRHKRHKRHNPHEHGLSCARKRHIEAPQASHP
jgi:hypothetical protein